MRDHLRPLLAGLLPAAFLAAGCADDSPLFDPDETPPAACLQLFVLPGTSPCPGTFHLAADPRCSTDDRSAPNEMSVRWDFDDDGTWDTSFQALTLDSEYDPGIVPGIWTVRCEVQDAGGNRSQATASLDVRSSSLVPASPDIAAGPLFVPDTVAVDSPFPVFVRERFWADASPVLYKTELYLDGVLWVELWEADRPSVLGCAARGRQDLTISTPGTYEVLAVLDAEDAMAEVDESNNTASGTIVVVPAPIGTSRARSPSPGTR